MNFCDENIFSKCDDYIAIGPDLPSHFSGDPKNLKVGLTCVVLFLFLRRSEKYQKRIFAYKL